MGWRDFSIAFGLVPFKWRLSAGLSDLSAGIWIGPFLVIVSVDGAGDP